MNELVLVPLDKSHLTVLQVWFKDSESQWVDEPSAQFVDYVRSQPHYYVWMVYDGNLPVAYVGYEIAADQTAGVMIVVNPEHRKRGYGKHTLQAIASRPEVKGIKALTADIRPKNEASVRCFRSAGYIDCDSPYEGHIRLVHPISA
ncbi:MAG: GNAT family N-acetyltransferase [Chloroflexi bacterium]|nr:GNAT family N-acetyltransferase [Chloroflexota bacterium]